MDSRHFRALFGTTQLPQALLCNACCCFAVMALVLPSAANAQSATSEAQTAQAAQVEATPAPTVCLTNAVKGGKDDKRPFAVVATAEKADELRARGFVDAPCATVAKVSAAKRQNVCETAQIRDPAIVLAYWQRYSVTPDEMCRELEPVTK